MRLAFLLVTTLAVASCASGPESPPATGIMQTADFAGAPYQPALTADDDYVIGATDTLNITTFQVEDLTLKEARVDASGLLQMPLIGSVRAVGRTPDELGREIERLLGERYLRSPQVAVTVVESASQKITVDGAVTKPGVYVMQGRTSLLQAIAMAEGPVRVANLNRVAVFRTVNDQRMVAVFDLAAIRAGQAADPIMLGDDIVVVDTSRLSVTMRDIISALPGLAIFGVF